MAFYTYVQNNSGGSFDVDHDKGVSLAVIVEADSAEQADARAQAVGVYFDPEYLIDCDCCGTRWDAARGDGDPVPSLYGKERAPGDARRGYGWPTPEGYIHYADGRIEAIGVSK